MDKIKVNEEKCIHCGLCIRDCFIGCLGFDDNKVPSYLPGMDQNCAGCQHCMAVCPKGALSFGGIDPDGLPKTSYVNPDELLSMIKSRRSVRSYKKQSVSQEKLAKIREMLSYPPTGGNLDNLHFTIVGSAEKMDEIRKATYDAFAVLSSDSPLYQLKGFVDASVAAGRDIVYAGAPAMIACAVHKSMFAPGCDTVDPIIALSYFELYAASLGLGTLWDDFAVTTANAIPEVYEKLEIPEDYKLAFILPFGEPAVKYPRVPEKNTHSIKVI